MFETDRHGFLTENGLMTVILRDSKFVDFLKDNTHIDKVTSEQNYDGRYSYHGIFVDYDNIISDFRAYNVNDVSLYPIERRGSIVYVNVENASRMIFIDATHEWKKPTRAEICTSIYISSLHELMVYHEYTSDNKGQMEFPLGTITQVAEYQSSIDSTYAFSGKRTAKNNWVVSEFALMSGTHSNVKRTIKKAYEYVRNR